MHTQRVVNNEQLSQLHYNHCQLLSLSQIGQFVYKIYFQIPLDFTTVNLQLKKLLIQNTIYFVQSMYFVLFILFFVINVVFKHILHCSLLLSYRCSEVVLVILIHTSCFIDMLVPSRGCAVVCKCTRLTVVVCFDDLSFGFDNVVVFFFYFLKTVHMFESTFIYFSYLELNNFYTVSSCHS